MDEFQKIQIDGIEYNIADSMQDFRAEDSFISRKNKLREFDGKGEAKKYVGSYANTSIERISTFFEYGNWGTEYMDEVKNRKTIEAALEAGAVIQNGSCFFSKSNLIKYLEDARTEYINQEQLYRNDISAFYEERLQEVKALPAAHIYFSIYDASDNRSAAQNRAYIRSDDEIWFLWRDLILPKISYLSILKLIQSDGTDPSPKYYFRVLLDYQYRSFSHPLVNVATIITAEAPKVTEIVIEDELIEEVKRNYRQGAIKYRKEVLDLMAQCPFTKITDERILVASHIKPYSICMQENRKDQALDKYNGLTLSPTYDRLFDQGYITFMNDGQLVCGTQLSAITWERLNINPAAKNKMRIYPENRKEYLEYHRKHVFLDDIDEAAGC